MFEDVLVISVFQYVEHTAGRPGGVPAPCSAGTIIPPFHISDDHSRITLKVENSQGSSDYINASPIVSTFSVD